MQTGKEVEVWKALVNRQVDECFIYASSKWHKGLGKLSLNKLPQIEDLMVPHWRVFPILGKSEEQLFWYRLSRGIFNVNMRLRTMENLNYLEERDTFHDVFGHLPILYDKEYSTYVRTLGIIGQYLQDTERARKVLSNLYWTTSEFGMVEERGNLKAYGAGILSSFDEIKYANSEQSRKLVLFEDIDLGDIADIKDYVVNGFQDFYVVLPSWNVLPEIIKFLFTNFTK